ncbi:Hsp20/alpha crystallin family protein [Afifella sp. H1R]|uniref:Hsp20/alpha crystallin family protein n=1 Tax=unclassified Afifella TaxID=2624128 RepID=UPI001F1E38E1|nr:Hsp20/alpha crystallin family protein [Afifella sp. H1R]MCF1502971.1 Hsp20/alpha crystallin family protein [Afifella sp. H1R]
MDFRSMIPFGRQTALTRGPETDPFLAMRREMDRLFDDFTRDWSAPANPAAGGFLSPKVDVAETETGLELTAELPGIDEKDIELDLTDGVLTLKAENKVEREEKDEKKQYHLVERSYGTFMRRFALPFEPKADEVTASFDKGVLKVTVPRAKELEAKGRKITVNGH